MKFQKMLYTFKNAVLFHSKFGENMGKPNHWYKNSLKVKCVCEFAHILPKCGLKQLFFRVILFNLTNYSIASVIIMMWCVIKKEQ